MTDPPRGLLVMAYGTPASLDDVEAYYMHIRGGRAPSTAQLADLTRRYAAIGGVSPLAERTDDQVAAIATALDAHESGRWAVALGNKHAPPFVEEAVAVLARSAPGDIVGLVLAPHYSRGSVGEYHERAAAAARERGLAYVGIDAWHDEPAWLEAQADRVGAALGTLPAETKVLFTAHSLPERVLGDDDPYPDQLRTSATAIAERAGLDPWYGWALAWQSAGRTPEPWRGPDVRDVIRDLAATGRAEGVLVCPQGFVSDHLEVLFDLDIDARRVAAESGLAFGRTASINDDLVVMAALAERVRRTEASPPDASSSGRGNGERWGEAEAKANGERSSSPRASRTVGHRPRSPDP
jgi:ferrochelatase